MSAERPGAGTELRLEVIDCLDGLASLEAGSVDLVVTSPPYNIGIDYGSGAAADDLGEEDYLAWTGRWTDAVHRVLRPAGSFFLNIAGSHRRPWIPHAVALQMRSRWNLQNTIHWIKSVSVPVDGVTRSVGHFKPINSGRYLNDCHEYLFHFTREGDVPLDRLAVGVPYEDKSNIARWGHHGTRDRRCRGNNWFIPYETIRSRQGERPHPATFPVELAARCIDLHGRDRLEVMLDPFVGIGHAAVAACDRRVPRFIGFDIDADFVGETERRLAARQGELPLD